MGRVRRADLLPFAYRRRIGQEENNENIVEMRELPNPAGVNGAYACRER